MRKIISRRYFERSVAPGLDGVLHGVTLPAGSVLHGIRFESAMETNTVQPVQTGAMGSIEGWVCAVIDVDATGSAAQLDNIWDTRVPKDFETDALDLDSEATFTIAAFEPGAQDWESMFRAGQPSMPLYKTDWISSVSRNSIAHRDPATPFGLEWLGSLTRDVSLRPGLFIEEPSVVLFGLSAPDLTVTFAGPLLQLTEIELGLITFINSVMENAMLALLSVSGAGASTVFEAAVDALKAHVDPPVFEATADAWAAPSWQTFGKLIVEHSVPGNMTSRPVDFKD